MIQQINSTIIDTNSSKFGGEKSFTDNVLIYQQKLMHYRVPVFNQLVEKLGCPVTVAVGSPTEITAQQTIRFDVQECRYSKLGPFYRNQELSEQLKNYSLCILPFDIHELATLGTALKRKLPLVLWGHSHGSRGYLKPFRRWMIRRSNAVIVYTQNGKDRLVKEGLDEKKIFVANNTLDIGNAGFNDSISRRSFLFSGRITKRKKVDEAIIAFARIKDQISSEIGFEVVGEGPEKETLENLAREYNVSERIRFHGAIYEQDTLKEIFQRSLAFVSPGHVGLGVLHSFAYGVPPLTRRIASHAPEFHHIEEGKNGLLFDGTIEDLASKMKSLADSPEDVEIGKNGHQYYCQNCKLGNATDGMYQAVLFANSNFN